MKKVLRIVIQGLLGIVLLLVAFLGYFAFVDVPREYMSSCPPLGIFKATEKINAFDKVTLKRKCYPGHPCVHYELSISGDGKVFFEVTEGHAFTQTAQLSPKEIAEVVQAINDAAYFTIAKGSYYVRTCDGPPTTTTSVTVDGKTHSIRRFCCAPPRQLVNFEKAIDRVANVEQWTKQPVIYEEDRPLPF